MNDIITIEQQAFYQLMNKVVADIKKQLGEQAASPWIDGTEAMQMLRITSPTTLAKLRNEGKIRYSQPEKKILLYDRNSILKYIESHAKDIF